MHFRPPEAGMEGQNQYLYNAVYKLQIIFFPVNKQNEEQKTYAAMPVG